MKKWHENVFLVLVLDNYFQLSWLVVSIYNGCRSLCNILSQGNMLNRSKGQSYIVHLTINDNTESSLLIFALKLMRSAT